MSDATTVTEHETRAGRPRQRLGKQPVVFVHGLWLLPSSWDRWAELFEEAGYVAAARPAGPTTPRPSRRPTPHPEVFAGKTRRPGRRPLRGGDRQRSTASPRSSATRSAACSPRSSPAAASSAASVAIDPAPFRGVLPLPISALQVGARRCWQPGQPQPRGAAHLRAVPLRASPTRSARTRPRSSTRPTPSPAPGAPLFQAAAANLNPWTEAKVDTKNPDRGPLLIISGEKDHTVPWAIANAVLQAAAATTRA